MDSGTLNRTHEKQIPSERSALRVGGIDYLNALPLTAYLSREGTPRIELRNLVPSALADGLRCGDLDVALVPVVEYLERDDYRIIPGICVSSYGAVESIRLYHRRPLEEVRRVGLDTSSRSSALLTRLFFRALWRGSPGISDIDPASARMYLALQDSGMERPERAGDHPPDVPGDLDAVLLIGDTALHRSAPRGWRITDLGNEWTRFTGLPFVYAFWVCREETCHRAARVVNAERRSGVGGGARVTGLVERFREARDVGLGRIDDIVRDYVEGGGDRGWREEARWRDYLARVIHYELGPAEIDGLKHFYSLLGREGLHERAPRPLEFVPEDV